MNAELHSRSPRGFVSYTLVLSIAGVLTLLMVAAYKRAVTGQQVAGQVQLRIDHAEKEDTVLRAIVAAVPNRAIRAMKAQSNDNGGAISQALTWNTLFSESLGYANARTSIPANVATALALTDHRRGNTGDAALATVNRVFSTVTPGIATSVTTNNFGPGYPVPLVSTFPNIRTLDATYPIISSRCNPEKNNDAKIYGAASQAGINLPAASHSSFNLIPYPNINFGYAKPGELFVAKRNWWSFNMDMANHDANLTRVAHRNRQLILSIYEIPSQLAISSSSFVSFGEYASGEAWDSENVKIKGGVFAGTAEVTSNLALESVASRRGATLGNNAVKGLASLQNPFAPGLRETHQITTGTFFPVSQASESGRVAFVPINRHAAFFDRFHNDSADQTASLSPTAWNDYTIGARQTAMRLDITACDDNYVPTRFRFSYMKNGNRVVLDPPPVFGLPSGYIYATSENGSFAFGTKIVDVAYGGTGRARISTNPDVYQENITNFALKSGVTGTIPFTNAYFGDPLYGVGKSGYYRYTTYPWELKYLKTGQICVAFYPKRLPKFLSDLGGDPVAINNAISINVDYSIASGSVNLAAKRPVADLSSADYNLGSTYGVVLQECDDLSAFTKGFSLITNMRLYMGDHFNVVPGTRPANYPVIVAGKSYPEIADGAEYFPPCSIFAPEKRYGVDEDANGVELSGQIGSLAKENASTAVRPLDSRTLSGTMITAENIKVNLRPIRHPADLPPIFMMNWLVVIEEMRREFTN